MRSALEWAQVRALAADGFSQREIARRLGINRRTVARLARSEEPLRYRRAPVGSQLDPFEPVVRRLREEWPTIKAPRLTEILRAEYGYSGSLRLVQEHLRRLRPSARRLQVSVEATRSGTSTPESRRSVGQVSRAGK